MRISWQKFTPAERFEMQHIPEPNSGCWLWTGSVNPDGYGMMSFSHKKVGSHRVAYAMRNGPIPKGLLVRHRCDNPACVNPDHLLLGTVKDNAADMVRRGRATDFNGTRAGEGNPRAILSWAKVREIRDLAGSSSRADLARRFGVSEKTIYDVITNRKWRS